MLQVIGSLLKQVVTISIGLSFAKNTYLCLSVEENTDWVRPEGFIVPSLLSVTEGAGGHLGKKAKPTVSHLQPSVAERLPWARHLIVPFQVVLGGFYTTLYNFRLPGDMLMSEM